MTETETETETKTETETNLAVYEAFAVNVVAREEALVLAAVLLAHGPAVALRVRVVRRDRQPREARQWQGRVAEARELRRGDREPALRHGNEAHGHGEFAARQEVLLLGVRDGPHGLEHRLLQARQHEELHGGGSRQLPLLGGVGHLPERLEVLGLDAARRAFLSL